MKQNDNILCDLTVVVNKVARKKDTDRLANHIYFYIKQENIKIDDSWRKILVHIVKMLSRFFKWNNREIYDFLLKLNKLNQYSFVNFID